MNLQLRIKPIWGITSVVVYPLFILTLLPSLLIIMQVMFYNSYFVLPGEIDLPESYDTIVLNT